MPQPMAMGKSGPEGWQLWFAAFLSRSIQRWAPLIHACRRKLQTFSNVFFPALWKAQNEASFRCGNAGAGVRRQ
jgi:hypothetical protein